MSPRAGLCSRAGVGFTAELARVVIEMPKAGKKNHILKDFFSGWTKKQRENGEGIRYSRKESNNI